MTVLLSHSVVPLLSSHIWWFHPHMWWFHHMWQFFCHIRWFPYFLFIFDGSILTLYSSNIICDSSFIKFGGSLFFFLTFEDSIVALGHTNITSDYTFVTFSGSLFFSHTWQFPYRVILPYSLYFLGDTVPTSRQHIIPGYQILTFDGFIFILCSSNITCDSPFVKFGSSLIFSNIWWFHPHIVLFHHHIWQYFCHIW